MNIIPSASAAAVSGTQLAQTNNSDKNEVADQSSHQVARQIAENGPQIQDPEQANDRDADGRQALTGNHGENAEGESSEDKKDENPVRQSIDPLGIAGKTLDLSG